MDNDDCVCEFCGQPLRNDGNYFLYCERCDAPAEVPHDEDAS